MAGKCQICDPTILDLEVLLVGEGALKACCKARNSPRTWAPIKQCAMGAGPNPFKRADKKKDPDATGRALSVVYADGRLTIRSKVPEAWGLSAKATKANGSGAPKPFPGDELAAARGKGQLDVAERMKAYDASAAAAYAPAPAPLPVVEPLPAAMVFAAAKDALRALRAGDEYGLSQAMATIGPGGLEELATWANAHQMARALLHMPAALPAEKPQDLETAPSPAAFGAKLAADVGPDGAPRGDIQGAVEAAFKSLADQETALAAYETAMAPVYPTENSSRCLEPGQTGKCPSGLAVFVRAGDRSGHGHFSAAPSGPYGLPGAPVFTPCALPLAPEKAPGAPESAQGGQNAPPAAPRAGCLAEMAPCGPCAGHGGPCLSADVGPQILPAAPVVLELPVAPSWTVPAGLKSAVRSVRPAPGLTATAAGSFWTVA